MKIFSTEVAPMLEEASMHFQVFVTEYAGHASELMKDMELSQWAGVVVVSGDGLVHEVINGIMQRTDWDSAIKLPIGCIPAGSCNALVSSINYAAAEPVTVNTVLHSAFVLVKHSVVPVDLVMVQTQSTQFYSFLSLTWGLIADANLESQKYRFLEAMKGLFNMTVHRGTLSFLPAADLSSWSSVDTADMFFKRNQDDEGQVHLFADNMADWGRKQSTDMLAQKTPLAIGDHGKHKVGGEGAEAFSGETATNVPMARALTSHVSQSVASDESRFGAVDPLLQNILESKGQAKEEKGDKGKSVGSTHESVHCDLLPPLHQPVGRDWVVFKGGFLMVCALFQSHIGRDLFLAPFSRLSDEVIHLMIIREDISRYRLLKLMMSFHKGTHIRCPEVQFVTVSAFRLEPGDYAGQIMVDGQRVEAGPLQAQVLPGMARVMAMK
ncbi:sphingosine kinase 2-like [Babylonia areolata]|uniref:sphingosine kinase 2-like n=1 Tax=Babylonia areolata TaxID=304850 RepID=UPI003FD324D6